MYLFFTELLIEPDLPCLADEIADARPDMNEVAAFTVSEKSIYTEMTKIQQTQQLLIAYTPLPR